MRPCDYNFYKIIYKITFEETGRQITEERAYHCVAATRDFAMAAFKRYHSRDEFISINDVVIGLDDLVLLP